MLLHIYILGDVIGHIYILGDVIGHIYILGDVIGHIYILGDVIAGEVKSLPQQNASRYPLEHDVPHVTYSTSPTATLPGNATLPSLST
jgi:pyruvate/2-oxoglutarate dehydrogenase complex dihydrolipoamide dehydrogenase (E3) component